MTDTPAIERFLAQVGAAMEAAAGAAPFVRPEALAAACRALLLRRLLCAAGAPGGLPECRLPEGLPEDALEPLASLIEGAPVLVDEAGEDAGAIGPEALAAVHERLRSGRHQDGVFYTPRGEVRFMCREALRARLAWEMAWRDDAPALLQWLYGSSPPDMAHNEAAALYRAVARLRVCDPAAGCGALLVGMAVEMGRALRRLAPLLSLGDRERIQGEGLPEPHATAAVRAHVVACCLFGIDVDAAALEVARQRLLLFRLARREHAHASGGTALLWAELQRHLRVGDGLKPTDASAPPVQLALFSGPPDVGASAPPDNPGPGDPGSPRLPGDRGADSPRVRDDRGADSPRVRGVRGAPSPRVRGARGANGPRVRGVRGASSRDAPSAPPVRWGDSFPEAFSRPAPGFDIVLSNPPYVRQELLEPDYKAGAATACQALLATEQRLEGKSDLYAYFYHLGLGLLREGGALCVISSNSWLDVGFGQPLRALLARHGRILSVVESATRSTFQDARVNPAIALIRRCSPAADPEGCVRFIRLQQGLGEDGTPEETARFLGADHFLSTPAGRVVPVRQSALAAAPDDHWGGRYLRAPDLVQAMWERSEGALCALDALAVVRFGIKTGANDFFYLEDVTDTAQDDGLRLCRNGAGYVFPIEERFLRPVLRSPREVTAPELRPEMISACLFVCAAPRDLLAGTAALRYIEWGESELGAHRRPSVRGRPDWYRVPIIPPPPVLHPLIAFERAWAAHNPAAILCDANLVGIMPRDPRHALPLVACLASSLGVVMRELAGIANLGQGALKTNPAYLARMQVPDLRAAGPEALSALDRAFAAVRVQPFASLLDGEPSPPWQELDEAVMSLLGPAAPRPEQVRAAARELVADRLARAGYPPRPTESGLRGPLGTVP